MIFSKLDNIALFWYTTGEFLNMLLGGKTMKILLAALLTTILMSSAYAANSGQDFKSLSAQAFKSSKLTDSIKDPKNDLAIVYGGEDISRKLNADLYTS